MSITLLACLPCYCSCNFSPYLSIKFRFNHVLIHNHFFGRSSNLIDNTVFLCYKDQLCKCIQVFLWVLSDFNQNRNVSTIVVRNPNLKFHESLCTRMSWVKNSCRLHLSSSATGFVQVIPAVVSSKLFLPVYHYTWYHFPEDSDLNLDCLCNLWHHEWQCCLVSNFRMVTRGSSGEVDERPSAMLPVGWCTASDFSLAALCLRAVVICYFAVQ